MHARIDGMHGDVPPCGSGRVSPGPELADSLYRKLYNDMGARPCENEGGSCSFRCVRKLCGIPGGINNY